MDKELRQSMQIITEEFLELANEAGYDEREQEKFNYFVISKSLAEVANEYLPIVKAILEFNYDFIAKIDKEKGGMKSNVIENAYISVYQAKIELLCVDGHLDKLKEEYENK